jgi:hypothetical protein
MNMPPVKCQHPIAQPRYRNFFWALPATFMIAMVGLGLLGALGCGETSAEPELKSVASSNTVESPVAKSEINLLQETPAEPQASGTAEQAQESDDSVLKQASDLFEKAKSKGGSTASGASRWVQDKFGDAATASGQTADESWQWATETFESLKSQGLTTAGSTSEWLGQDWSNMESWQYKVTTLTGAEEELESQLNEFGKQGWECFNIEQLNDETRFFFKKPSFSYLRHLPFKDFIKLVPLMTNGDK